MYGNVKKKKTTTPKVPANQSLVHMELTVYYTRADKIDNNKKKHTVTHSAICDVRKSIACNTNNIN